MRILYLQLYPLQGSGSGTYARELAKEVAKTHTVAMVVPEKRPIRGIKIYNVEPPVKIAFTGHPEWPDCKLYSRVSGHDLSTNYLSYFNTIVMAMDDFKPDIIHVHHLMPLSWIARFIKIAYGVNYVVTAHGSEIPTLATDRRYHFLTGEALTRAAKIVPNSPWTKEWMDRVLGKDYDRQTRVIPGGVAIENYPMDMGPQYIKDVNKKFGLYPEWKLVLFSGKLTKYKGVKYLVQAAKKIDGVVGIVGDGPERKNLEAMVRDQKIQNVKFFGHRPSEDIIKLNYRAAVTVAPSIWDEPLGLVVLEAMAAKTPVVVTKKGGIPLMVKEGENGLFVKAYNANDIAEKVNVLLHDEEKRKKMGEIARKTVESKFTWELIAQKYEKIYQEFRKKEPKSPEDAGPLDAWIKSIFPIK